MAVKYKTCRVFFSPAVVEEMTRPGAQTVTSCFTSLDGQQIKRQNVIPPAPSAKLFQLLETGAGGHGVFVCVTWMW